VNADTFVQLITLMEESAQPPHIEFALARGTRGIEFVEEVRSERPHG
jgi:hypothetical protein